MQIRAKTFLSAKDAKA